MWICSQNTNNYYFCPQFDLSFYLDIVFVFDIFDNLKHNLSQKAEKFDFFNVGYKPKDMEIYFYTKKKYYNKGLVEINILSHSKNGNTDQCSLNAL